MIYTSPSPSIEIPEASWGEYFDECISAYGRKPAMVDTGSGRTMSYAALGSAIRSVAGALQRQGYKKGDVLAIYAPNSIEFVVAFQAVLRMGGIVTTVNPLYTEPELIQQLQHSAAIALFTVTALAGPARKALQRSSVRRIFFFDQAAGADAFVALITASSPEALVEPEIAPYTHLAVVPYSSGTTGLPKGVMLTHANLVAHNLQTMGQRDASVVGPEDRVIAVIPFFHIFGMTVLMNLCLSRGACLVILPRFEAVPFLAAMQEQRVTRAYVAPPIVNFLAQHPQVEEYDLSCLNYVLSGAAPLSARQGRAASERLGCLVCQGYGMTEMSPVTHVFPDQSRAVDHASIGVLICNTEAKIVDVVSGSPAATGEPGELLLRGPQMMLGYLNDPESTAATIDAEGWLYSGDVARVDATGLFFIVDRVKELIKYKGYQIAPAELEGLLMSHPAVADAAVVPIADDEAGEVPKAFIVPKGQLSEREIMDWVSAEVAPYKKIRTVEFIDQVPRSASGKILRRQLAPK